MGWDFMLSISLLNVLVNPPSRKLSPPFPTESLSVLLPELHIRVTDALPSRHIPLIVQHEYYSHTWHQIQYFFRMLDFPGCNGDHPHHIFRPWGIPKPSHQYHRNGFTSQWILLDKLLRWKPTFVVRDLWDFVHQPYVPFIVHDVIHDYWLPWWYFRIRVAQDAIPWQVKGLFRDPLFRHQNVMSRHFLVVTIAIASKEWGCIPSYINHGALPKTKSWRCFYFATKPWSQP